MDKKNDAHAKRIIIVSENLDKSAENVIYLYKKENDGYSNRKNLTDKHPTKH